MNRIKGFSLIELLITVAILGFIVAGATYYYSHFNQRQQSKRALSQLMSVLQYARQEALLLDQPLWLCPSVDGQTCSGSDWSNGLIIELDKPLHKQVGRSPVLKYIPKLDVSDQIHWRGFGPKNKIQYSSSGMLSSNNGRFQYCNSDIHQGWRITLNQAGRAYAKILESC